MLGQILVVDDDRLVLATVSHGLMQAGFSVLDADNGDDAILLAHQYRPDLALLDIRMEGKTGFDVAAYLRDGPRIPFMFLSAFSDEKTRAQARELGAVDYLVKPVDVAALVPRVGELLERIRRGEVIQPPAAHGPAPAVVAAAAVVPAQSAAGAPPAAVAPGAATLASVGTAGAGALQQPLSLAVGVLMHRHGLARRAALERLERMAAEAGVSLAVQADRLLTAVEELARSN